MRLHGIVSLILLCALPAAAGFKPRMNIADLARISWKNGEAKLAIRNDWVERYLNISLNEAIRTSSDIKSGSGEMHVQNQNPNDSIIEIGFSFNVVPDRVWFDPHVLCEGRLRLYFPQTALANARAQVMDREPIEHCEVNGSVGHALDLGRLVKNKLNAKIASLPDQNFLLDIGKALFGNEDLRDRMTRMYLLQELIPQATLGMDDCEADSELGLPMGNSLCLKLRWPAPSFDAAVAKILNQVPAPQPVGTAIPLARVQQWRDTAPVCVHQGIPYPSKAGCDTGDMNLFSGLLCLSGEQIGCQMVRDSQDATGRWWRSPQRLGRPGENFSPDMFLGSIAYFNQTRDAARLQNWVRYITGQPRWLPNATAPSLAMFQSCPDGAEGVCNVMGSEWYWLQHMRGWSAGLSTFPDYGYDSSWLVVEALSNERGFRLHLVAVNVLMQQMFGLPFDQNVLLAAKILAAREPQNPFFNFLALGRDQRVLNLIDAQCPAAGTKPANQHEWAWERKIEDRAYAESMGWDCVFMANLWNRGLVAR